MFFSRSLYSGLSSQEKLNLHPSFLPVEGEALSLSHSLFLSSLVPLTRCGHSFSPLNPFLRLKVRCNSRLHYSYIHRPVAQWIWKTPSQSDKEYMYWERGKFCAYLLLPLFAYSFTQWEWNTCRVIHCFRGRTGELGVLIIRPLNERETTRRTRKIESCAQI